MKNKYAQILRLALVALVGSICPSFAQSSSATDDSNISSQEIAARQANLRSYFHRLEENRNPLMTRTLPNGDVADFVPRNPNAPTPPVLRGVKDSPQPLSWFQKNPALKGPPGTVPLARFDIEGYLSHVKVPSSDLTGMVTPPHIYSSSQEENTSVGPAYFYHVLEKIAAQNFGGSSGGTTVINNFWKTYGPYPSVANPYLSTHSLFEVSIASPSSSTAYHDTVEWGYTQDITLNGTANIDANGNQEPYYFCFFTTNYYGMRGDNMGGYNSMQAGYNQWTSELGPGFSAVWNSSIYQGNQTEIQWSIVSEGNAWWLYVGSLAVGYYYQSIFQSSSSSGGLGADVLQTANYDYLCNGEVATGGDTVDGNGMGSGLSPVVNDQGTLNFAHSAYVRNFGGVVYTAGGLYPAPLSSLHPLEIDDPGCYNATTLFYDPSNSGLINFWYYGGQGNHGPTGYMCYP